MSIICNLQKVCCYKKKMLEESSKYFEKEASKYKI